MTIGEAFKIAFKRVIGSDAAVDKTLKKLSLELPMPKSRHVVLPPALEEVTVKQFEVMLSDCLRKCMANPKKFCAEVDAEIARKTAGN